MANTDLLLCPYCGGEGNITTVVGGKYLPSCSNESCIAHYIDLAYDTYEEAVEGWNKRFKPSCATCLHNKEDICEMSGFVILYRSCACSEYGERR